MNKILIIIGPTATGKTSLAINLAKKFSSKGRPAFGWDAEIISCDSRQVYIGLDIGTGKMPKQVEDPRQRVRHDIKKGKGFWQINGIKVWMYDVVTPDQQYTVADYVSRAEPIISDILERGKLPIIVGGTGLYLTGLLEGIPNLEVPLNHQLRRELNNLTKLELQLKLQTLAPKTWESMNNSDRENPRRLLRAIELASMYPYKNKSPNRKSQQYNILKVGLTASREVLYKNVDLSITSRLDKGMIEEVISLKNTVGFERLKSLGLEYRVIIDYLEGKINHKLALITNMQNKTHNYVKRQLTWFKQEKNVQWFDITDKSCSKKVENLVTKWYDS